MTRIAAVLVTPGMAQAAPPGVDRAEFLTAMAEDTYEMVAGLELVRPVILSAGVPGLEDIAWPGTPVLTIASPADAFAALPPEEEAVIVSADAPDLPPLLIGKLFRELGRAHLAVCPAEGGGAVAVAARLPVPSGPRPTSTSPTSSRRCAARRRVPAWSPPVPAGTGSGNRRTWPASTPALRAGTTPALC